MLLQYISSPSSCCSDVCKPDELDGTVAVCQCMADTRLQVSKMGEGGESSWPGGGGSTSWAALRPWWSLPQKGLHVDPARQKFILGCHPPNQIWVCILTLYIASKLYLFGTTTKNVSHLPSLRKDQLKAEVWQKILAQILYQIRSDQTKRSLGKQLSPKPRSW